MTKKAVVFALTLIRHGETQCNKQKIIQGQQDVPLSEEGIKQAVLLGSRLQNQKYTHVYASDLTRALQTTKHVLEKNKLCKGLSIQKDERLRERKYGDVEGKPVQDLRKAARKQKVPLRNYTPTGAETIHQVRERAVMFFKELCQQMAGRKLENLHSPSNGNTKWKLQLPHLTSPYSEQDPKPPDKETSAFLYRNLGASTSKSTEVVYVNQKAALGREEAPYVNTQGMKRTRHKETDGIKFAVFEKQVEKETDKKLKTVADSEPKQEENAASVSCVVKPGSPKPHISHSVTSPANCSDGQDEGLRSSENASVYPIVQNVRKDTESAAKFDTKTDFECSHDAENNIEHEAKRAKFASRDDDSPSCSAEKTKSLIRTTFHIEDSDDDNLVLESEVYKDVTPNVVVSPNSKEPVVMRRCDSDPLMDMGDDVVLNADILLVSHGGFLRELIRHFIDDFECIIPGGDTFALTVSPNTGVSKFMISFSEDDDKPQLTCIFIHDREHLNFAHYRNTTHI